MIDKIGRCNLFTHDAWSCISLYNHHFCWHWSVRHHKRCIFILTCATQTGYGIVRDVRHCKGIDNLVIHVRTDGMAKGSPLNNHSMLLSLPKKKELCIQKYWVSKERGNCVKFSTMNGFISIRECRFIVLNKSERCVKWKSVWTPESSRMPSSNVIDPHHKFADIEANPRQDNKQFWQQ